MFKNIVVIEDDKDVIDVIRYFLEKENFRVHVAKDGIAGLELAAKVLPNLILLDLSLPKVDGIEVCKRLKSDRRLGDIPLIMVTARGEIADKIEGFKLGADDYVTKPFHPQELVARVHANLRRREGNTPKKEYQYEGILVDTFRHEVHYKGDPVELTAKEFELLLYLVENKGRILSREMILNHVWGYDYYGTSRTVDVHITHLRQKISLLAEAITTVKPLGYKLKEKTTPGGIGSYSS